MEELIYCHNRKCDRSDCIRREIYMPFNVLCRRRTFKCSSENKYKYFLGEDSAEGVDKRTYIDIIKEYIRDNSIKFYIEPFVGNSNSINSVNGDFKKYGTDVDESKIKKLIKKFPDMKDILRVGDYKVWSKILLDEKYYNHCLVFCESPLESTSNFDFTDFLSLVEEWSKNNIVLVRLESKEYNKLVKVFDIDGKSAIFKFI